MTTSAPPTPPPNSASRLAAHVRLYLRRRFVTPFDKTSEYRRLDRWLTLGLFRHPTWWRIGGYMSPYEARTIVQFAITHKVRDIGQIGFLAGHFVCSALTIDPFLTVTSFDIGTHKHSRAAARWLKRRFGHRSDVIWGDSQTTFKQYAEDYGVGDLHLLPFQLVIVDGDHSYEGARRDLLNVWYYCETGTYVVMDDLGDPDGVAFDDGPARAWHDAMSDGHIEFIDRWTEPDGHTFAVGRTLPHAVFPA